MKLEKVELHPKQQYNKDMNGCIIGCQKIAIGLT